MGRRKTGDVRVVVVRLLQSLNDGGGSLTAKLPAALASVAPEQRALLQSLAYDLARWSPRLQAIVDALLAKPLKRRDTDVYLSLQLGVLQLEVRNMPAHAAVDTTVSLAGALGKPWARGLINGVLRHYQRHQDEVQHQLTAAQRLAHPDWLLQKLQQDWPDDWEAIAEANNTQGPMTLRVNRRHATVAQWQDGHSDFPAAHRHSFAPDALTLEQPCAVESLPGFASGTVSVQDAAAQLAAPLLGSGQRMLDACAAPGGKTAHALEFGDWEEVVALDKDPARLERVAETLKRLDLQARAHLLCADAAHPDDWWDQRPFDAVLLDAPCSGTGVIRRHPDIKLLRRQSDIDTLVAQQECLLEALWPLVAPGGILLYATCSVLKCENEQQIARFVGSREAVGDVRSVDPVSVSLPSGNHANWGRACDNGRQMLPGDHGQNAHTGVDGFYYAVLRKRS